MKKNKKVDAVRVFNHAAVVLEDAAHDFDDSMQCLRSTLLEVHFAAQDRGESVAALEREADAFRDDEKLRRFFVSAAVDARNGFDLDAEVAEGTEAAARCAHDEIDRIRRVCQEANAAADAAEKELAGLEFELAEFSAPKDYELALDAVMPNDVTKRVVKAFGLSDCNITTVGDAVAAISERAASDARLRAYQWIGDMMSKC